MIYNENNGNIIKLYKMNIKLYKMKLFINVVDLFNGAKCFSASPTFFYA